MATYDKALSLHNSDMTQDKWRRVVDDPASRSAQRASRYATPPPPLLSPPLPPSGAAGRPHGCCRPGPARRLSSRQQWPCANCLCLCVLHCRRRTHAWREACLAALPGSCAALRAAQHCQPGDGRAEAH